MSRRFNKSPGLSIAGVVIVAMIYLVGRMRGTGHDAWSFVATPQSDALPAVDVDAGPVISAPGTSSRAAAPTGNANSTSSTVAQLFRAKQSDTWVETAGRVQKLLDDDTDTREGSDKHQRFLLQTDDGVTVFVAHNLSAANRVPVKVSDRVTVRGEYEWSDKGGTIHFTHAPKYQTRDVKKSGWIEHAGRKYE